MTWLVGARDEANLVPFLERYGMAADLRAAGRRAPTSRRAQYPGHRRRATSAGAHRSRSSSASSARFTYDERALARGAGGGPALGAAPQAARERARRALADARHLHRDRASRARPLVPLPDQQVAAHRDALAGRPPRAAASARTPRQCSAERRPRRAPASCRRAAGARRRCPRAASRSRCRASASSTSPGFSPRPAARASLAALGAESLKVEWKDNPDTRLGGDGAGRRARGARARRRRRCPASTDPDMGGQFNNKNPGKRGISLNIRDPRGPRRSPSAWSRCRDVVAEGFSPGVLDRLGPRLRRAASRSGPDIIYVAAVRHGQPRAPTAACARSGPIAAAFAGTSEMSGLPEPAMPAGWGYSYLDWMGAYSFALAILGALYHRDRTGRGPVDRRLAVRGRPLPHRHRDPRLVGQRPRRGSAIGNRSPYKPAAPHGAYRCPGDDRWLAIACFDEEEWQALAGVAGHPNGRPMPRFATLDGAARQPGRARRAGDGVDEHAGRLRVHGRAAGGRRAGRRLPDRRRPLRPRSRSSRRSTG